MKLKNRTKLRDSDQIKYFEIIYYVCQIYLFKTQLIVKSELKSR
jgi:hypothetical protein